MFSLVPVMRLSTQTTPYPSAMRRSQRWLPRKPAPPVTSARGLSSLFTSKALVPEAGFAPGGRVENVAAINDELRITHQGSRFPGVEVLEDLPFRHQHG